MQDSLSLRHTCVRDTLNCLAAAMVTAMVVAFGCHTGTTFALRFTGELLTVTALAQGVLSWLSQFMGNEGAALGTALGGISAIASGGILLLASFLV